MGLVTRNDIILEHSIIARLNKVYKWLEMITKSLSNVFLLLTYSVWLPSRPSRLVYEVYMSEMRISFFKKALNLEEW